MKRPSIMNALWCLVLTIPAFAQSTQTAPAVDLSFYTPPADKTPYPIVSGQKVRNIILMIGDGMGLAQLAAARIKAVGPDGRLHIDRMPIAGLMTTHSADHLVTDSAAAATAMATALKTNNGMISIGPNGSTFTTILEAAHTHAMRTGLVATSSITDDTPAAFASHVPSKTDQPTIAEHLLKHRINVLLGGGRAYFLPTSTPGGRRTDTRNLLDEARRAGYIVLDSTAGLAAADADHVLGLFWVKAMTTERSRDADGFFLMSEGSQIDWKCHANNAEETIREMLAFDMAVAVALGFAAADGRTLIVVTGDHETGGMAINDGTPGGQTIHIGWTTKGRSAVRPLGHTGTPVPIYAFGPGAMRFTGLHDNTAIAKIFAELLGMGSFPKVVGRHSGND